MSVVTIDPPVVDAHAHIFKPDMPTADSAWFKPTTPTPPPIT